GPRDGESHRKPAEAGRPGGRWMFPAANRPVSDPELRESVPHVPSSLPLSALGERGGPGEEQVFHDTGISERGTTTRSADRGSDGRPNVATNSLASCAGPLRAWSDNMNRRSPNITCAIQTPTTPPVSCAATYAGTSRQPSPPCDASATDTAGLKWAPEMGPNVR